MPNNQSNPPDKPTKYNAGRPSDYRPEMIELLDSQTEFPGGATITEISELIGCKYSAVYDWMEKYPDFKQAIARARGKADRKVERSLFLRALGYVHPEEKIFPPRKSGDPPVIVPTTKNYPPDTEAALNWLYNRDPENWKRKEKLEHELGPKSLEAILSELKAKRESATK